MIKRIHVGTAALVIALTSLATNLFASNENSPFPPPPDTGELVANTPEERQAGVVVLLHEIEFESQISNWSVQGEVTTRHVARFWVRAKGGVEVLKQHTFFGDESNVVIGEIRGRTISADGTIHLVDPEKDIRNLDIRAQGKADDLLRTVNFPRVEPGAVLDLAWESTSKNLPGFETIRLEGVFPVRKLEVRSQGRLIGLGKSILLGTGQFAWVPFLLARVPEGMTVRMSNQLDMHLTAENLPVDEPELFAPPESRTSALLGILPQQMTSGDWRDHLYLMPSETPFPESEEGDDVIWASAPVSTKPLASIDSLGLQAVSPSLAGDMEALQLSMRSLDANYRSFVMNNRRGERSDDMDALVPEDISWDEKVDWIFNYVREQVVPDSEAKHRTKLDRLKKQGRGAGLPLFWYAKWVFDRAGMDSRMAMLMSRDSVPLVPVFDTWDAYSSELHLELTGPGGQRRYIQPHDLMATPRSMDERYLGGVFFREPSEQEANWELERMPMDVGVLDRTDVTFRTQMPEFIDNEEQTLEFSGRFLGSADNKMRWLMGYPNENFTADELQERRDLAVDLWVKAWMGLEQGAVTEVELSDPRDNLAEPYRIAGDVEWRPDIFEMDGERLLPSFPRVSLFENLLVAQTRRHPVWLPGGEVNVTMEWTLPEGWVPESMPPVKRSGPTGLQFELRREWDGTARNLVLMLSMTQPYVLPVQDYFEVAAFFRELEALTNAPVLVRSVN
ncbi:hypothetical protein F3N42_02455 [Marinihelvus fidelis]|uniref:DUF3857 domain-containing protein n=1 Tax=Marinihelvus fidelis TaxID=2613842 RepID=A0A5N0TFD0_9GAMM|nr:hypothetical protein [Marinihelvus fidelis]KAA9133238.1 hypothetical protein F3N42_02455 [Marinihelvus fidelis]